MKIVVNGEAVEIPGGGGGGADIPIGCVMLWTGGVDNIPAGWQLCDGTDGTVDLRDKFVLGGGGTHPLGETGGSETVTLTVEEMPEHGHTVMYSIQTGSGYNATKDSGGRPEGTIATNSTGGSQPHNNMPPYVVLCYIQRVGSTPAPAAHVYGASWDGSSTTLLTRTDDAADFSNPVPAVGTGAGSSPFDSCYPWSGMEKITDGENVLVKIPKYWVKVSHSPFQVQISDQPREGFQVSPAHRDRGDGQGERDYVYIGRYECGPDFKSKSGQAPKTNATLAGFRSGIHGLGAEYWQADYALQLTWWYLYIVEYANWNGQTAIGQGNVSSSAAINTGATDSMTYHTGCAAGTDGQTAVQYRNIENPWGNVREWRDGIIFSDANIYTYNNPADFKDTYNGAGAVARSNKRHMASDWIKAWGYDTNDPSFIYPSAGGGSATTFVPDYCYYNTGVSALNVGGSWSNGVSAGPFDLLGNGAPSNSNIGLGSRLQKLPNAA